MSRKKYVSSYSEKLYYDNTVFYGILASTDANYEGYFKQLVNFDIADTGLSLQPRKGFLATALHLSDNTYVSLNYEHTIYYQDHSTGVYYFIDFTNARQQYIIDEDARATITTLIAQLEYLGGTDLYIGYDDTKDMYYETATKSYTTFERLQEIINQETDKPMYMRYQNLQTLLTNYNSATKNSVNYIDVYKSDISTVNNSKYIEATKVSTIVGNAAKQEDKVYLFDYIDDLNVISTISPISSHQALYAKDTNLVDRNVIKCTYGDEGNCIWLEFKYNEDDDAMLITICNTNDNSKYVDLQNRNIASFDSVVPDPLYKIYTAEEVENYGIYYSSFPIIYAYKGNVNKTYQMLYTSTLSGLNIAPSFYLIPPEEGYEWVYTYSFYSTSASATDTDNQVYDSDLYKLDGTTYRFNLKTMFINYIESFITDYGYAISDGCITRPSAISDTDDYALTLYNRLSWNSETSNTEGIDRVSLSDVFNDATDTSKVLLIYVCPKKSLDITISDAHTMTSVYMLFNEVCSKLTLETYSNVASWLTQNNNFLYGALLSILDIPSLKSKLSDDCIYYIQTFNNITGTINSYTNTENNVESDFMSIQQTALTTPIYISYAGNKEKTSETTLEKKYYTKNELLDYLSVNAITDIIVKPFLNHIHLTVYADVGTTDTSAKVVNEYKGKYVNALWQQYFNNYFRDLTDTNQLEYDVYTTIAGSPSESLMSDVADAFEGMFIIKNNDNNNFYPNIYYYAKIPTNDLLDIQVCVPYVYTSSTQGSSVFNTNFVFNYDEASEKKIRDLINKKYFSKGINMSMYFIQAPLIDYTKLYNNGIHFKSRALLINSTSYQNSISIGLRSGADEDKQYKIDTEPTEDAYIIRKASDWCVFYSVEGYRLVVWGDNKVYVSEPGVSSTTDYNYFKEDMKFQYAQPVVKVLPYKDMLIVFTTENMYSIFPYEITESVASGTDEDGNTTYTQSTTTVYNTLPVLYNISTSRKFKDVIQIYNSMILFYSTDGQLYVITPSSTIDSDTVFSIKYLNKSANDILLNYTTYINSRLKQVYGFEEVTVDDIIVNASATLSYIKLFYSVQKYNYTYILLFNTTSNKFTVYDTITLGKVNEIFHCGDAEVYLSVNANNKYNLVTQYSQPSILPEENLTKEEQGSNCDYVTSDYYVFEKKDINTEIDTGILFLNNQWMKRFRNLRTIYKNLDATVLEFTTNVIIDDVYVDTILDDYIEVKNINGYYAIEKKKDDVDLLERPTDCVELLEHNTALFDFSAYNSNKILTHVSSIPSMGKHIEVQLRFKSKGKYKIQGFALVYKEHGV